MLLTVKPIRAPPPFHCLFSVSHKWLNVMTGRCCRLCPCFLCCPFPPPTFPPPLRCSLHYIICCSQQVYSSPNVSQLLRHLGFSLFACLFGGEADHSKCWNTHINAEINERIAKKEKKEDDHCQFFSLLGVILCCALLSFYQWVFTGYAFVFVW